MKRTPRDGRKRRVIVKAKITLEKKYSILGGFVRKSPPLVCS